MEIKNRVLKTELVDWRKLSWLQSPTLKEISKASFEKLKNSVKNNSFLQPFNVWQDGETLWICDGHHRQRAMQEIEKEGNAIPDLLPANFIECKDRKEAQKLVLIYSSIYAKIEDEQLYEFIKLNDLDFDSLKLELDIPGIDLEQFAVASESLIATENLAPYRRTHVLLSFDPRDFLRIESMLKSLRGIEGLEIEQSSN